MRCSYSIRTAARCAAVGLLMTAGYAFAQDTAGLHGWPRADAPAAQSTAPPAAVPNDNAPPENPANEGVTPYTMPAQLTVPVGTFITVRVNQTLSSDENQPGDAFSATLVQPIVVDGIVVAQRGQIVGGRVAEAQRAGRVQGVSRLAVQLTDLTFVDGQQARIQSQLAGQTGRTSVGRDATAVGTTTAMGAMIGAAADWGTGAAIGAGVGAAAGAIGVLLTRGHPSVIYPESVLTFRLETPVSVSTDRSPQAFRYVDPSDYQQSYNAQLQPRPHRDCAGYGCQPPWYSYPGYYGPAYYGPGWGPYWGPSFSFFIGRGFYGPRYYGPRFYGPVGYHRHGYRR